MDVDVRHLLLLSTIPGIGPARLRALINHFEDPSAVAKATAKQISAIEGIERKTAQSIVDFFRTARLPQAQRYVDDQLKKLNKVNGRIVTLWDKKYPSNLKRIYDPPPFLFVSGEFVESDNHSIAIVGTRTPSSYGTQIAERFAGELAKLGIPIVSGLARGIDTCAHAATIKVRGRAVAIIGSGLDVIYPPENKALAERIVEDGAVVSEFAMGAKPDAGNFPRRNRLISGMSLGSVIVETGIEGGAMITAAIALDQNREVFAVPSAISDKRKSGTNHLIKEGKAVLVESIDDILSELVPQLKHLLKDHEPLHPQVPPELTLFEHQLYDVMDDLPIHIDTLAERAGLPTSDALVQLLSLEFKGAVKQLPGKMFVRL
jgi:DNA processing protein